MVQLEIVYLVNTQNESAKMRCKKSILTFYILRITTLHLWEDTALSFFSPVNSSAHCFRNEKKKSRFSKKILLFFHFHRLTLFSCKTKKKKFFHWRSCKMICKCFLKENLGENNFKNQSVCRLWLSCCFQG